MSQREQWRNDAVVLDLFEGGHWNPENTISWLRRQGPSVWHELARGFHWGNSGVGPLRAIVEFPNCDRATVMSIFALATPDYYEDELASGKKPEVMDEPDRFIVAILDAISDGFSSGMYVGSLSLYRRPRSLERLLFQAAERGQTMPLAPAAARL